MRSSEKGDKSNYCHFSAANERCKYWTYPLYLACWAWATGLGFGFLPVAPGTWGALWGLPLVMALRRLPDYGYLLATVAIWLASVGVSTWAARRLGAKDPSPVVCDEWGSLPVTFFLIHNTSLWVLVAGFVLNRMMDILKPPPARRLERLPEGWGIMADDLASSIYANLLLRAAIACHAALANSL